MTVLEIVYVAYLAYLNVDLPAEMLRRAFEQIHRYVTCRAFEV